MSVRVLAAAAATAAAAAAAALAVYRRRQPPPADSEGALLDLIGNTPLVELKALSELTGCTVLGKCEFLNPGGCKDRAAKQMVLDAERSGRLRPGGTIVEGTSGSTGISLALVARARGYRCVIVMPDDQAAEKYELLRLLGAEVEKVRPAAISNPQSYCRVAERRAKEIPGAAYMDQFENEANFRAHLLHTGPEIAAQCPGGVVDAVVAGAGTGGTIAGVSQALPASVRVVLADPPGSSLCNYVNAGVCYSSEQAERSIRRHRYDTIAEGIGLERLTANFRRARIDEGVRVSDREAVLMSRFVLQREGLFLGSSSAFNLVAAVRVARDLGPGHTVVCMLTDHGSRHLSKFWNDAVVEEHGLPVEVPEDLGFISSSS